MPLTGVRFGLATHAVGSMMDDTVEVCRTMTRFVFCIAVNCLGDDGENDNICHTVLIYVQLWILCT